MKLSISSLTESGAFSGAPVEKEIQWQQGEDTLTGTVYIRRLSYETAKADIVSSVAKADGIAARIAACILDEEGKPIFTAADVNGDANPERGPLNHNLTIALLTAIGEVNHMGKSPSLPTKKESGTS